jgi:hypothetical protein
MAFTKLITFLTAFWIIILFAEFVVELSSKRQRIGNLFDRCMLSIYYQWIQVLKASHLNQYYEFTLHPF